MGLGRSSRISRKGDLITKINLSRSMRNVPYDEIVAQSNKLWRKTVAELIEAYRKELIKQTDWSNDPSLERPPWEKGNSNACL